jgi:uncharacterized protein (TIGR02271 family)
MTMINTNNIDSLIGANVMDSQDRKIGTVGQIYVDNDTNQPSWVTINTGLFGTSESFAPLERANWDGEALHVGYEKGMVKDAPRVDNDGALDRADEDALYQYYGISSPTGSQGMGDTTAGMTGAGTQADTRTTPEGRTQGYDTSGPTTDDAMTRSEEQLRVGTEKVQAGRARLRKHVVTENQTVTVPVSREEVTIEREPITDANVGQATSGPDLSDEEHEVQLTEERVVVDKKTVPVERVRLGTETVTEEEQVSEDVRKEQIEFDESDVNPDRRRRFDDTV